MAKNSNKAIFNAGTLLGDPDLQNMLQRVDDLNISLSKKINQDVNYNQLADQTFKDMLTLISAEEEIPRTSQDAASNTVQYLLKDISVPIQRQNRYRVYDELYSSVQIIKRIIQVYSNNILQKDIVTGKTLTLLENKTGGDSLNNVIDIKSFNNSIIKYFKLEHHLSNNIINILLRYGDCYIELIDLKKDIFNLPDVKKGDVVSLDNSVVINESTQPSINTLNKDFEYFKEAIKTNGDNNKSYLEDQLVDKAFNYLVEFEDDSSYVLEDLITENTDSYLTSLLPNSEKSIKDDKISLKQFKINLLNRFLIRIHNPKKIVNLTMIHNDTVLGYVEVQEKESIERVPGVGLQFATILKQISTVNKDKTEDIGDLTKRIVKKIISKIIEKSGVTKKFNKNKKNKEINREFEQQLHAKIGDDLFYMVKKLFNESDLETGPGMRLGVRYIPPDNIIHLCLNPVEYYPYGTSIIDPLVYPAKLYLLTQLTNMVIKLSRASLIRKWTIEAGPREHGTNLMQKLKREIRNQRITVDDIVNFKSIPKILSDFKDMMILTKKGTKFVDVDVQSFGDPNLKVADLEDTRKELIALSGVPAPYLGYNDVVDLREQLVNINITFATDIISIQTVINEALTALSDKIASRLGFEETPSNSVTIALKPPVILLLQMLEATMSSIGNIQMSLQSVQIDFNPYYLLKKFVPNIDWDDFETQAKEYVLYKNANTPPTPPAEGGM